MKLEGKVINFLGDSITYGYGVENAKLRFSDILKQKYNLKSANNYGICGTRIAKQNNPNPNAYEDDLDFCSRVGEMDENADIVLVFGGVNDYQHGDAPMGDFSDCSPETFCGALNFLYGSLKEKYRNSEIVIVSPLHMLGDTKKGGQFPQRKEPLILFDYVSAIKNAAIHYGFHFLDLFSHDKLNPNATENRIKYMPDGIHPNAAGHEILAEVLGEFLENL